MDEPTLAQLADGRLMMVMRGSNDRNPELPAYKWVSWSADGGVRWTTPRPWTYQGGQDGQAFFSPSACSQQEQQQRGFHAAIFARRGRRAEKGFPCEISETAAQECRS